MINRPQYAWPLHMIGQLSMYLHLTLNPPTIPGQALTFSAPRSLQRLLNLEQPLSLQKCASWDSWCSLVCQSYLFAHNSAAPGCVVLCRVSFLTCIAHPLTSIYGLSAVCQVLFYVLGMEKSTKNGLSSSSLYSGMGGGSGQFICLPVYLPIHLYLYHLSISGGNNHHEEK